MSSVRLVGIEKRFGDVVAVRPLDLEIAEGELVVLVGPSGCGKTTILRMIAGLEEPSAGQIYIGGRHVNDVEPAARDIAMVFQNYALYPHMAVRHNLAFGLKMRKTPRAEIGARVARAAAVLGLEALLDRKPAQLSGGQRQRVALGRALVREPAAFLFDEPLSNLDARLRVEMRAEIAELHRRLGTTMIFVTHDQVEAMTLGQRIAVLRDGALQQYAPPLTVYAEPANRFVAGFIGTPAINVVEGTVSPDGAGATFRAGGLVLRFTAPAPAGPAALGIRPEAVKLVPTDAAEADLPTTVQRLEPLGNELLVHCGGPAGATWVVRVEPRHPARVGDRLGLRLARDQAHLFAGQEARRVGTGAI